MLNVRIYYALLSIICVVVYASLPHHVALILLLIVIFIPIVLYAMNKIAIKMLSASLVLVGSMTSVDKYAKVNLTFENRTTFPIIKAKITLKLQNSFTQEITREKIIISIPGDNKITIQTKLSSKHCGNILVDIQKIEYLDLLCLTSITQSGDTTGMISFLPNAHMIQSPPIESKESMNLSNKYSDKKSGDDKSQVFDYHEYVQGDRIKNINWKLSSRLDKLIVKEFSDPISSNVMIMTDLFSPISKDNLSIIDSILETTYSISLWLSENETFHDVAWLDTETASINSILVNIKEGICTAFEEMFKSKLPTQGGIMSVYNNEFTRKEYSHFIYITSVLDENLIRELPKLEAKHDVCVVYIKENAQEETKAFEEQLHHNHIELFVVSTGSIKSDLQKIRL